MYWMEEYILKLHFWHLDTWGTLLHAMTTKIYQTTVEVAWLKVFDTFSYIFTHFPGSLKKVFFFSL